MLPLLPAVAAVVGEVVVQLEEVEAVARLRQAPLRPVMLRQPLRPVDEVAVRLEEVGVVVDVEVAVLLQRQRWMFLPRLRKAR